MLMVLDELNIRELVCGHCCFDVSQMNNQPIVVMILQICLRSRTYVGFSTFPSWSHELENQSVMLH